MEHRRYDLPLVIPHHWPPWLTVSEVLYNMSLGVCGLAIPSELGTLPLRSQTQGIIGTTQAFFGWLIIFVVPYMINPDAGNLGGKVCFVFFGFGVVVTVLLFLFMPETKGLSYEDVCSPKR